MSTTIENINKMLHTIILKQREQYVIETLNKLEQEMLEVLPEEEVSLYMQQAKKIVFKK